MPATVPKLLTLQLSEHYLHAALFETNTLVRYEEFARYPSPTAPLSRVASWLKESGENNTRVLAATAPSHRLLRLSSARGTPFAELTTLLALPPGQEPVFTACNSQTGDPTECRGFFPRLLAAAPLASLRAARNSLAEAGLNAARVFESTYVQLGAMTLARETLNSPALVWDIGADASHFITLDQRGILAVEFCPVGVNQVQAAIQTVLGLRFATAATKLLMEGTYDFSDDGPKIVRRFLPQLRQCLTRLPVGPKHFHISGLGRDQQWLTIAIAQAWCLEPLSIDWTAYGRAHGISFASRELGTSLPASFGGLLLLAKHRDSSAPAWQARWSDEPKPKRASGAQTTPDKTQGSKARGLAPVLNTITNIFAKNRNAPTRRNPVGKPSATQA